MKIRRRMSGTSSRPRLSVFRSGKHIYAQIIDDEKKVTIIAYSDTKLNGKKKDKAFEVGKKIGQLAKSKKISEIVFDRGGFFYHGRIAELARGAREGGLKF